jgi:sugar porter (SP) family MFS transporter
MTSASAPAPTRIYFFGALAELLFGYDIGIIGVALLSINVTFSLTPVTSGLVVSSLLLGAAIGVGTAGRVSDRIGRKPALLVTSVLFIVGGILAALAPVVELLIAGRLVMGLGVGASAVVVTVYLVEVAPTQHRGKIGSLGQLMVVFGILLAYVVGYALQPAGAWHVMLGASVIPAAILAVGLLTMPESPRWLVAQGRTPEAIRTLHRLGRGHGAEAEAADLQRAHDLDKGTVRTTTAAVLREMFAPGLRRNTVAAIVLATVVQLVGTNSILYYAPSALVSAGLNEAAAVTANLAVGIANVAFTFVGLALVDRIPRRRLLTLGITGMTAGMIFLAVVSLLAPPSSAAGGWLTLAGMVVFQSSFAASWGLLVRVVVSELFPSSVRGTATGLVLILNWLANFLVGQFFPVLLAVSAALSFAIFAVISLGALFFVRIGLPETGAGRTLEDVTAATPSPTPSARNTHRG